MSKRKLTGPPAIPRTLHERRLDHALLRVITEAEEVEPVWPRHRAVRD